MKSVVNPGLKPVVKPVVKPVEERDGELVVNAATDLEAVERGCNVLPLQCDVSSRPTSALSFGHFVISEVTIPE